jgi:hypothetical protein
MGRKEPNPPARGHRNPQGDHRGRTSTPRQPRVKSQPRTANFKGLLENWQIWLFPVSLRRSRTAPRNKSKTLAPCKRQEDRSKACRLVLALFRYGFWLQLARTDGTGHLIRFPDIIELCRSFPWFCFRVAFFGSYLQQSGGYCRFFDPLKIASFPCSR